MHLRLPVVAALSAVTALSLPASAFGAEAFYGVARGNVLVTFQSDDPADFETAIQISNLAPGDEIVGIDERPSTNQILGLGRSGRVYDINPRSGSARPTVFGGTELTGSAFGFDVNPVVDRFRVVSDQRQNLRMNPDNGATVRDGDLNYAAGDPGAGTQPNVQAVGYTNSTRGADTTQLFGIDNARGTLVLQNPPNEGVLRTVGSLQINAGAVSFDVGNGNVAYASLVPSGGTQQSLYRIDLASGKATAAAAQSAFPADTPLVGFTSAGVTADDRTPPRASVALSSTQLNQTLLAGGIRPTISSNEAFTYSLSVRRGRQQAGSAVNGFASRQAGLARPQVRLNAATRAAIRRSNVLLRVTITVTDGAGNATTQTRSVRSQSLAERRAG